MDPGRPELFDASDATIEDAVQYADPLALRGLLYQLTGDPDLTAIEVRTLLMDGYREMSEVTNPDDIERIRTKAAELLKSVRDSGAVDVPPGPAERWQRSLSLAVGFDIPAIELDMWLEELAVDPWVRGLEWSDHVAPPAAADFSVIVIGAGMGGLNAAVHLKRAGIPFTVLEKNACVGGTWYENRYPGARVDSPSRIYTHAYGAAFPYPYPFCPQPDNEKYFNWIADTFDLRPAIQFNTEVTSLVWDESAGEWEVSAESPAGTETRRANAVISAVGLLSRPNIPTFEGIDTFDGACFHTARWPVGFELEGKRVAVIGTGCTGYQLIPEIVNEAGHVYVFQRTPSWVNDIPGYLAMYPEQVGWLDRNFPYLVNFSRFQASYLNRPHTTLRGLRVDPDFHDEHAVSAIGKQIRDGRLAFLEAKLGQRPDLLAEMTPKSPPLSSRPVLVDREYSILDVLVRDDVTLVTEGIDRVTADGIDVADGTHIGVDVIVLATGFRANDFLRPMEMTGRAGIRLDELWAKDGARAYVGSMLPGFPNFFMLYGPNTNSLAGLQIVAMEEMATRFALENIAALVEQGRQAVEVTEDAYWRYNAVVDEAQRLMTYVDPRARSYYQNEFGRSATQGPLDSRLIWRWLRDPAGRRPSSEDPPIDESLMEQYRAVDPRFGADLAVS